MSIDSIVGLVAGKIGELLIQEGKLLYGVEDQVRSLHRELGMMNAFLIDMEGGGEEGGDARSRATIAEIRKIAYDAEDVIESYVLAANKTEGFPNMYACLCSSIPHVHQVGTEIEAIKTRISETLEGWAKYVDPNRINRVDAGAGPNRGKQRRPIIAYPYTNEDHVIGLDKDINKLVGVLTTDCSESQVLSIVGMGGSGKTTLARKLYNHESVKQHFDCIAWLSVSREWVAEKILLGLLRKASGRETKGKDEGLNLQELEEKLHHYLEAKTYLIVLDDVWEKEALNDILPALPTNGRRIIITTRKREVIDFPDLRCSIHEPRRLTEEESWELFKKMALIHREQSNNSMGVNILEILGKAMLKRCEGLPLAVIALAGILGKKETLEEWEQVNKVVSSMIVEEGWGTHSYGSVKEMIGLSYKDMAHDLKPCFLYLAKFPEDHEIRTGQLIRMWIAEGFITAELKEGETLEDVARGKLDELIQRYVVQIASINYKGRVRSIRVHDLVRDLCIKKAKEQDFLEIFTSQSSNSNARVAELRRTAIYSLDKMYLPLPTKSHHLRSLVYEATLAFDLSFDCGFDLPRNRLRVQHICDNFRLLRVLILECVATRDSSLPAGIGSLIHLRYLGLRWTNIRCLPSSIGNLRNLLTLDYHSSLGLTDFVPKIPNVLWKLEGLRYLNLGGEKIKGIVKLHTLKHLQTLKGIKGGSWMLEELPRLSPMVRKLDIYGIKSEEQLEAAFRCPSIMSDNLHSLKLAWGLSSVMLENLQPINHCQHLRKLSLSGIVKDRLSSFNQIPTSIIELKLGETRIEEEVELAALGKLPNLMCLELQFVSYMGAKWTWIAGQFSQLRFLRLDFLPNWEEWSIETGAMPQLTKLIVENCGKLRRLPEGLKFITTLQELFILEKGDELKKRIKGGGGDGGGGGGEDAHIIQHVPLVEIHDVGSDQRRDIVLSYMEFILSKEKVDRVKQGANEVKT